MPLFDTPGESAVEEQYPISINYQGYWKEKQQFVRLSDFGYLWVMIAVEDGCFCYTIDNVAGEAGPGDIVFCPPNTDFHREVTAPLSFYYVKFRVRNDGCGAMGSVSERLRDVFAYKFTTSEQDRLFNNFRHLIRLNRQDDPESDRLKLHFVADLWLLFYLEAKFHANRDQVASDPLMKNAKEMIERHALRDVQIQDIAVLLNIHPVQLTRRFQHVFGISPSRYLIAIRIEKAKMMLVETDKTIEYIARRCGYENGFYFSRMFTKYTKMNPSHFRRIHRELSP